MLGEKLPRLIPQDLALRLIRAIVAGCNADRDMGLTADDASVGQGSSTAASLRVCADATIGPGAMRACRLEPAPYERPRRMRISLLRRAE